MSLYHEAVQVLQTASQEGGSIKSLVFGKVNWKSDPRSLFAVATETAKWSKVLSEVIDNAGLLKAEKQLTPELALVLTHDLLLNKRGLVLPQKHGLTVLISRHRARLSAELTKARVQHGFTSLEALRAHIDAGRDSNGNSQNGSSSARYRHPRWIRINTLRTTLAEQLESTFVSYKRTDSISDITNGTFMEDGIFIDEHIPNLVAIPPHVDVTSSSSYKTGKLILQDKASCFPASLLNPAFIAGRPGDYIDACAAPGNKTTHLAALVTNLVSDPASQHPKIFACERDPTRSKALAKMVQLAGANDMVHVRASQDFLRLDPRSGEFAKVTAILLDPSCSGSGIVGRDEAVLDLHLPTTQVDVPERKTGKKRKRNENGSQPVSETRTRANPRDDKPDNAADPSDVEEASIDTLANGSNNDAQLLIRLNALSSFQLRLLEHAMSFPSATRITYSTCSLHDIENEHVVVRALMSGIARQRGWHVMRREEQVDGLRRWAKRGNLSSVEAAISKFGEDEQELVDTTTIAEACIRCEKGGEDGTMGFFVAGFVRVDAANRDSTGVLAPVSAARGSGEDEREDMEEDEWEGFSDED